MNANDPKSPRAAMSDLERVDSHQVKRSEYEDLPELTDDMVKCGSVMVAGVPGASDNR
ncbi:MAG: hypothetical protein ABIP56_05810 [Dokdonella sp.]